MRTHELKTRAEWFDLVATGAKPFELRRDDRGFEVGDELWLREISESGHYTGRELRRLVTCVVRGPWLAPGHVGMGLRDPTVCGVVRVPPRAPRIRIVGDYRETT